MNSGTSGPQRVLHERCEEAAARFAGRPVLVTGASGFIGGRLVSALLEAGARLTVLTRWACEARKFQARGIRVVRTGLMPGAALDAATAGQQVIFNFAYDVRAHGAANFAAFEALCESALRAGVARIVQASSVVVYDDWPGGDMTEASSRSCDDDSYRGVKTRIERRLSDLGTSGRLASAALQPTIVYGPKSRLWSDKPAEHLLRGRVVLPDAPGRCHAVFVDDVVQAALLAGRPELQGAGRYIISGPEPTIWQAFYEGLAAMLGSGSVEVRSVGELSARLANAQRDSARPRDPGTPPLAARASLLLQHALGRGAIDRIRVAGVRLARLAGPAEILPTAWELELYLAQGTCSIDHARDRLGYQPCFDLASGLAATREYLIGKYGVRS